MTSEQRCQNCGEAPLHPTHQIRFDIGWTGKPVCDFTPAEPSQPERECEHIGCTNPVTSVGAVYCGMRSCAVYEPERDDRTEELLARHEGCPETICYANDGNECEVAERVRKEIEAERESKATPPQERM